MSDATQQLLAALRVLFSIPQLGVWFGAVPKRDVVRKNKRAARTVLMFAHAIAAERGLAVPSGNGKSFHEFVTAIAEITMGNYNLKYPDARKRAIQAREDFIRQMAQCPEDSSNIRFDTVQAVVDDINKRMLAEREDFMPFDVADFGYAEVATHAPDDLSPDAC
jgi:hypothetical protein